MKNVLFLIVLFFFTTSLSAQLTKYKFSELETLQMQEPKPVLVFVTADWCSYCQLTENTTFKNSEVIDLINEQFYFVELNVAEKEDIEFFGKVYRFRSTGYKTGSHELAEAFAYNENGALYPTTVIFNKEQEVLFKKQEFLKTEEILKVGKKLSDDGERRNLIVR